MQKYKVFLNEKRIVFSSTRNITLTKPTIYFLEKACSGGINSWLLSLIQSGGSETVLEHANPDELVEIFRSCFLNVDAAGGVVRKGEKLLFIFRNGKWDLPKGKIDEGETPEIAGPREVEEECGITGHRIVKSLPSTYHIYQSPYKESKGLWIFKETFWYEMEYDGTESGAPQTEEGITEVRWFKKDELDEVLENTYENLKQIIRLYLD